MAETVNIAKMADKLSTELFGEFLWQQVGPKDTNWQCVDEHHNKTPHSSDVVFYYDNPYERSRTYVTCDVKSYAKATITAARVRNAVIKLARALTCAEKSIEWQQKYLHQTASAEVAALLFIYNHDGVYDNNFDTLSKSIFHEELEIPKGSKLIVLGPSDIYWLYNVRYEIVHMRGAELLPSRDRCRFHYPNLVRRKEVQPDKANAATLEMLTAPWITLQYDPSTEIKRRGYVIFYRPRGETIEEFLYLIDYLMHYQILDADTIVHIRTLDPHPNAPTHFGKAIDQYIDHINADTDVKKRLEAISFSQINTIHTIFSEQEIGMRDA